jgi:hypothetical protein
MNQARPYAPDFDEAQSKSGRAAPAHDTQASPISPVVGASVRSRLVTPVLLLFLLGTLDVLLTLAGLARGGAELNPYARWLLHGGLAAFAVARFVTLAAVSLVIVWLAPAAQRTARACLASACLVFLLVDLFSLAQLVIP